MSDTRLLDWADQLEAEAAKMREEFYQQAYAELAEMEHEIGDDGYDEPDWGAIHEAKMEWRGRDRAERMEQMGVEGW